MKNTNYPKSFLFLLSAILFACLIFSCKKENNSTTLSISGLSVNTGPFNTAVVISGEGFEQGTQNDQVFFNGVPAEVLVAGSSKLTVKVPASAGTGRVTVKVGTQTATGPVFTYIVSVTVSTYAGDGYGNGDVDGIGTFASISQPEGIAVDSTGNVYVAEQSGITRFITPGRVVSQLNVGVTRLYYASGRGCTVDNAGNFYLPDDDDILKRTPAGVHSVFAGAPNQKGNTNGPAAVARFNSPTGITTDSKGNFYVTDYGNNLIRKITADGIVSTYAGTGISGNNNGAASTATFRYVSSPAMDKNGNLYVSDGNLIRKITADGVVSNFAGSYTTRGHRDGPGSTALFYTPAGIAVDNAGNLYECDVENNVIRKVTPDGVVTTFAGTGVIGNNDGPGSTATFWYPSDIAIDKHGNLFVADSGNNLIRKITLE